MTVSRRSPQSQSKHDKKVSSEARNYRRRGYGVKADIAGFPQPHHIGGHRPDIIAKKRGHETAVEVETRDSVDSSHAQAQNKAFTRARQRDPKKHYRRITVD